MNKSLEGKCIDKRTSHEITRVKKTCWTRRRGSSGLEIGRDKSSAGIAKKNPEKLQQSNVKEIILTILSTYQRNLTPRTNWCLTQGFSGTTGEWWFNVTCRAWTNKLSVHNRDAILVILGALLTPNWPVAWQCMGTWTENALVPFQFYISHDRPNISSHEVLQMYCKSYLLMSPLASRCAQVLLL